MLTVSPSLVRVYGNHAMQFQDNRQTYYAANGYIDLPPHLVQRALDRGFSRQRPASDLTIRDAEVESTSDVDVASPPAPVISAPAPDAAAAATAAPVVPANPPATQIIQPPADHPESDALRDRLRREAEARQKIGAPSAPAPVATS